MWLSFSATIILIILINSVGSIAIESVKNRYEEILDRDVARINYARDLEAAQKDLATKLLEFVTINKVTAKQEIEEEIEKGTVAAKALMELSKDEASVKLLDELREKTLLLFDSN